jgi:hypothetical protein
MSLADFPDAETMLNQMLLVCEHPRSVARVKFGDLPWQSMPGPLLLKHLEGEVRELKIDSVTLPAASRA